MQEFFFGERGIYYRMNDVRSDRPTLLLLHGLSGSSAVWHPYEERFKDVCNIISPDLRGHGKSWRWPTYDDYDTGRFADDIEALLRHVRAEHYVLAAHSFGTLVALELLLRRSGAARALLLAPNYAIHRLLRSRLTHIPLAIVTAIFSRLPSIHWRGDHVDYAAFGFTRDWDYRRLYVDILNTGIRTYLHCLHHVYSFSRDKDWARISIPTTIVHGALDSFVPVAYGIELSRVIPNARFAMSRGANHMLVLNDIDDVASAIETLIGSGAVT